MNRCSSNLVSDAQVMPCLDSKERGGEQPSEMEARRLGGGEEGKDLWEGVW